MSTDGHWAPAAPAAAARTLHRPLGWLYLIGGAIGLAASTALMLEKLAALADPAYVPFCSVNAVLTCGSVMDSPQASVFGFPNPLIGVAAFSVVVTAGVALLNGFAAPRWFWLGLQLGTTLGVVFVHWLISQTLYDIGALCLYCMVVWAVTIPIFLSTTLHNLDRGYLPLPGGRVLARVLIRIRFVIVGVWYLAVAALVLQRFWNSLGFV